MSDDQVIEHDAARAPGRDPAARLADHAEIARLADDLLPALIAKLGASGLDELEVREGPWRVRLRMPPGGRAAQAAGPRRGGRVAVGSHPAASLHPTAPAHAVAATSAADGPQPAAGPAPAHEHDAHRVIATAPAVGFYRPRAGLSTGSRVRAGERLGAVDVLGVPHEVVAPEAGVLGAVLVEPGEPVEYGQEIAFVERLQAAGPAGGRQAAAPAEVNR